MAFTNIGKRTQGRDFNLFERVSVTSSTFQNNPDLVVHFPNTGIMFMNEGSGIIEVSFNGNTVHTELNSADTSKTLTFYHRQVSTIWLRVKSGGPSINLRVEAW